MRFVACSSGMHTGHPALVIILDVLSLAQDLDTMREGMEASGEPRPARAN